eukprot:TRINITY_DN2415_c0_g1_i11.p1 TRINITY_DN2415_c0_g1~~TRINITY_DN2415_c0_g1_i11.p1  ORF type:complete len:203 (-),score=-1.94 TRINITY_DN2415_c0_g1_i11:626-1234(-)
MSFSTCSSNCIKLSSNRTKYTLYKILMLIQRLQYINNNSQVCYQDRLAYLEVQIYEEYIQYVIIQNIGFQKNGLSFLLCQIFETGRSFMQEILTVFTILQCKYLFLIGVFNCLYNIQNFSNSQRFWSWLKEARRVFKEGTRRDNYKERDLFYQARFLLIITILEIVLYILLLSNVLIGLLLSRDQKNIGRKIFYRLEIMLEE